MIIIKLLFTLLLVSASVDAWTRDLIVIKRRDCSFSKGFILSAEGSVQFVDLSGRVHVIPEDDIDLILTYGINASAFHRVKKYSNEFKQFFKKIYLRGNDEIIYGFPFQYIEDLVFIHSNKGKIIVLGLNEISSIEDFPGVDTSKLKSSKSFFPNYDEHLVECGKRPLKKRNSQTAIRVMGDNLKVSEYLSIYRHGERGFRDLQDRTHFYAKPYLFPKRNRMGITQISTNKLAMPFYYQWATGRDFHFQSVNQFGGTISRYIPSFETNTIFSTEFKSHFFHGYFEGNLAGLSAGELPLDFTVNIPKESSVINNFNYYAFMGVDWHQFSFSYGGGYFTPYFNLKKYESRELAANSISNAARIAFTNDNLKLNFTAYFMDDAVSPSFKTKDQFRLSSENNIIQSDVTKFSYKATYYRAGAEWRALDNLLLSGDLIMGSGDYKESGNSDLSFDYKVRSYLIGIKREFGHYITLTFLIKDETYDINSTLSSVSKNFNSSNRYYGGVFELLF